MEQKFLDFLRLTDSLTAFMLEFKGLRQYYKLDSYFEDVSPANYLASAFDFEMTRYGLEYWDAINKLWCSYLRFVNM